jgi:hypothetical protein
MLRKLSRRALFVLTKIDQILAWEKQKEIERDTRFAEPGRYLCEVRAAAILASRKREIPQRIPGKTVSGVAQDSLLLDVDPCLCVGCHASAHHPEDPKPGRILLCQRNGVRNTKCSAA